MPPRPVQTTFAVQRNAPIYIDSFGNLVPPQDVNIQAQVTGEIKEVHFTDGQEVKKGDLLFIIDPSPYQAELDKAKAAVAQDEAALKLAKDTLERNRQLVASNLISAQDFEKYETDVSDTEARLRLDQANVELAQINLGYCSINSPVDGLTGKCQVDAGNIVTANTGPILVTVKSIDTLYVDFTIPEKELGRVRAAMESNKLKVDVIVEGDPRGPYSGEVIFINNTVDNTTGTFAMRAAIDNKNRALWAGQFVHLHLILGTTEGAVLVPYEAVQLGQKGAYLFAVTADNKAEVRLVETGNRQGEEIVVKDGVKAGEKVVVSGQLGLSNGASVVDVAELKKQREKKKR
jgi:multidrug efflux system membrane fusion protein